MKSLGTSRLGTLGLGTPGLGAPGLSTPGLGTPIRVPSSWYPHRGTLAHAIALVINLKSYLKERTTSEAL